MVQTLCVRWGTFFSFFLLSAGVRQGGVLSPHLFAIFVDDIVYKVQMSNVGCYISSIFACIYLYADNILLMAPGQLSGCLFPGVVCN